MPVTADRKHALWVDALIAKQLNHQARTQASVAEASVNAAVAELEAMRAIAAIQVTR